MTTVAGAAGSERTADGGQVRLDEDERLVVYYTALLVNVGCHADAHEQAKWFGDDISFKATKYKYEQRSILGAAASLRRLGSGNPSHTGSVWGSSSPRPATAISTG